MVHLHRAQHSCEVASATTGCRVSSSREMPPWHGLGLGPLPSSRLTQARTQIVDTMHYVSYLSSWQDYSSCFAYFKTGIAEGELLENQNSLS